MACCHYFKVFSFFFYYMAIREFEVSSMFTNPLSCMTNSMLRIWISMNQFAWLLCFLQLIDARSRLWPLMDIRNSRCTVQKLPRSELVAHTSPIPLWRGTTRTVGWWPVIQRLAGSLDDYNQSMFKPEDNEVAAFTVEKVWWFT